MSSSQKEGKIRASGVPRQKASLALVLQITIFALRRQVRLVRTLSVLFLILVLFSPFEGESAESPSPLQAYFFYSEDCPSCGGILHSYLPGLKSTYPFLEVQTLDIKNPTFYESLVQIEKQFGRSGGELPILIIGDQILSGEQEIMEKLEPLIFEYQCERSPSTPSPSVHIAGEALGKDLYRRSDLFLSEGMPSNVTGQATCLNISPRNTLISMSRKST